MKVLGVGLKRWQGAALIATVVLIAVGYSWLFREYADDNPYFGMIAYKFKWGYAHTVEVDSDRDGRVDYRMILEPGEKGFYTCGAMPLAETLFDTDQDGRFEARGTFDKDGGQRFEIDADNDGIAERILEGEEAKAFVDGLASC